MAEGDISGFGDRDVARIGAAVSFYEHNPRYPTSQRKYGGPPPIVPIKLLVATEDFEIAFPCSDLMFGACVPFLANDASGSSLQECHTEGDDDYTVYQIRAASCTGGSATISQEIVQSGDYLYCWFNPQSARWEVVNHIFNRCSYSCGWNPATGSIFSSSDTISGDMELDIFDTGGGGKSIKAVGTGEAIATGLMKLSSFATSPIIIQCYPYTPPDSMTGQYWFGVAGGPGVLVDLDAELIWFVTLNSDGTINTTYNAASYPTTDWQTDAYSEKSPRAKMGWCQLDCDRLTILGYGDNGDTATPLAHWPIDQPHVDTLLAFGTTVPAATDGTWWNLKAICTSGLCSPCSEYTDWPTPCEVDVTGLATLALNGSAPHSIDMTDLEDLSGILVGSHLTDPSGVEWATGERGIFALGEPCQYRTQSVGTVGTYTTSGRTNTITAAVSVLKLSSFSSDAFTYACVDFGALPDLSATGNTYIAARVAFSDSDDDTESVVFDLSHSNVAIYKLIGSLPDDNTPTAFGLVCVYHDGTAYPGSGPGLVPMSCADARNVPYIDPGSWPSSIDVAWIPTAPACGSDPPTTSTSTTSTTTETSTTTVSSTTTDTSTTTVSSTTTETSTTTVSSTTTDTSTTTVSSTTTDTSTTTASSTTTDTSTTTSGSTTESTTTDTSTTGTGSTTTETSTTTLNCGSYTTEWTWNGSSWDLTVNNCPEGCTPVTPGGVGGTVGDMVESSCS